MMYTVRQSHKKLREDMVKFITKCEVAEPDQRCESLTRNLVAPVFRTSEVGPIRTLYSAHALSTIELA
jgi:hypothetical protein